MGNRLPIGQLTDSMGRDGGETGILRHKFVNPVWDIYRPTSSPFCSSISKFFLFLFFFSSPVQSSPWSNLPTLNLRTCHLSPCCLSPLWSSRRLA